MGIEALLAECRQSVPYSKMLPTIENLHDLGSNCRALPPRIECTHQVWFVGAGAGLFLVMTSFLTGLLGQIFKTFASQGFDNPLQDERRSNLVAAAVPVVGQVRRKGTVRHNILWTNFRFAEWCRAHPSSSAADRHAALRACAAEWSAMSDLDKAKARLELETNAVRHQEGGALEQDADAGERLVPSATGWPLHDGHLLCVVGQ